jgi:hypothetical protein
MIDVEFDSGQVVTMKQGDIIVMRGVTHCWKNNSTVPAVTAFILIDAVPFEAAGEKRGVLVPTAFARGDVMDIKPLLGLGGVLIAAMASEFNDQVTAIALTDIRGALGISHDSGTWIDSLYVSAEIVGMAISPWMAVTFTLRRWTLFAIALCCSSSVPIPFSPNIDTLCPRNKPLRPTPSAH